MKSIDSENLATVPYEDAAQERHGFTQNVEDAVRAPVALESLTLELLQSFAECSGIHVNLALPDAPIRLPKPLELVLYHVLQESLTNVHRRSQTHCVDIQLAFSNGDVVLEVRDRGKGMPTGLLGRFRTTGQVLGMGSDMGLSSARKRVSDAGGRFEIKSDDNGTLIKVVVPSILPKGSAAGPN